MLFDSERFFIVIICVINLISAHFFLQSGDETVAARFDFTSMLTAGVERKIVIKSLKWQNCGSPNDPGKLHQLQIRHTPLGDMIITTSASTAIDLYPPISLDVEAKFRQLGAYFKVPCVRKMLGSCSYKDLCKHGLHECPFKPMRDARIPCQCPIARGTYGVQQAEFPMPMSRFSASIAGNYIVTINLFYGNRQRLACYTVNATIA